MAWHKEPPSPAMQAEIARKRGEMQELRRKARDAAQKAATKSWVKGLLSK